MVEQAKMLLFDKIQQNRMWKEILAFRKPQGKYYSKGFKEVQQAKLLLLLLWLQKDQICEIMKQQFTVYC